MAKSQTPPTVASKTTDNRDPETRKRLREFHKRVGQSMVNTLNRHTNAKKK